jgi:hypothetical protein
MSQKQSTDTIERIDVSDSANGSPSKLAELARQAYQQRRTKDCLDLTRALLLIDPDNIEAQQMRSVIRTEIQQDLDNARTFLRQAQSRQGSEGDPGISENPQPESFPPVDAAASDADSFVTEGRSRKIRWIAAAAIAAAIIIAVSVIKIRSGSNYVEASVPAPIAADQPKQVVSDSAGPTGQPTINIPVPVQTSPVPTPVALSRPLPVLVSPVARASSTDSQPDSIPPAQPPAAAKGFLAVSSPTSVEIYENGSLLGSVPVSLELSAGVHTLEYRHGNLRKILTHIINGSETTKASIAFEVNVQVNSRPWARVFLEGADRKELGQTPMSSISVPIGGVLTFENPQFQAKKYRVTGNETGIQIVFP